MVQIQIRTNGKELMRHLKQVQRRAFPQALADATNRAAERLIEAETENLSQKLDRPNRFTLNAFTMTNFGGHRASVRNPSAVIVAKPIQDAYLAPAEFGEPQALGKGRSIRTPVQVKRDGGGNIPKGTIAKLLARGDVFLGTINGTRGLWQRPTAARPRGATHTRSKGGLKRNTTGKIRLLIALNKPIKIATHLGFRQRAVDVVTRHFEADLAEALQKVLR